VQNGKQGEMKSLAAQNTEVTAEAAKSELK
jgi:hypothetical protein